MSYSSDIAAAVLITVVIMLALFWHYYPTQAKADYAAIRTSLSGDTFASGPRPTRAEIHRCTNIAAGALQQALTSTLDNSVNRAHRAIDLHMGV